jgi:hypothetical protein
MIVELGPDLGAAVREEAERHSQKPEEYVVRAIQIALARERQPIEPRDDWERAILAIGIDCGVSLPDSAFDRENLY